MASHVIRLLGVIFGLTVVLPSGADAANKARKPKAAPPQVAFRSTTTCRDPNLFHCGPIYNAQDYLGNDPDPFIRLMIQRDLGAKYGGAE